MQPLKSKEEIVSFARWAAIDAMNRSMPASGTSGYTPQSSITSLMIELISIGIEAAIRETLRNMYTNEEFERDTGLNS